MTSAKDKALKLALEDLLMVWKDRPSITAIREALAEQPAQQQEPLTGGDERRHIICLCPDCTKPAQQQEPVAYDKTEINCFAQDLYDQKMREGKRGHYESMFYVIHQCIKKVSPPASKPWVGLDDTDLDVCDTDGRLMARYWERVLREKNA